MNHFPENVNVETNTALIDNIAIDFFFSINFASMEDIKRKCNLLFVKFTSNKNILSETVTLNYNQICKQTFVLIFLLLFFIKVYYNTPLPLGLYKYSN